MTETLDTQPADNAPQAEGSAHAFSDYSSEELATLQESLEGIEADSEADATTDATKAATPEPTEDMRDRQDLTELLEKLVGIIRRENELLDQGAYGEVSTVSKEKIYLLSYYRDMLKRIATDKTRFVDDLEKSERDRLIELAKNFKILSHVNENMLKVAMDRSATLLRGIVEATRKRVKSTTTYDDRGALAVNPVENTAIGVEERF